MNSGLFYRVNVDYRIELKANERKFESCGKVLDTLITPESDTNENEHSWRWEEQQRAEEETQVRLRVAVGRADAFNMP